MDKKVVLQGYYGYGNLGDDVLMLTAYGWVKENFPTHEILICSDSPHADYIPRLTGDQVKTVRSNENIHADWIIHGGGGIYFDFKEGSKKSLALNKIIRLTGFQSFRSMYRLYRNMRGNSGITATRRAGLGIGIGTYTASSRRFYGDIVPLAEYDFLMVRDTESAEHFKALKLKAEVLVSTDLAFLQKYWKGSYGAPSGKKVGFILRDWIYDGNRYFGVMRSVADQLIAEGYDVRFYSFDKIADKHYISEFSSRYPVITWDPYQHSIGFFLGELANCSLLITSRAHGAILSACIGVPSVCLGIEPKLEKISLMLKRSSVLVKQPFISENIIDLIKNQWRNIEQLRIKTQEDAAENSALITNGLSVFRAFINRIKE
jgi:polysaccharide pyruvyl transferase WcaK-like protein